MSNVDELVEWRCALDLFASEMRKKKKAEGPMNWGEMWDPNQEVFLMLAEFIQETNGRIDALLAELEDK